MPTTGPIEFAKQVPSTSAQDHTQAAAGPWWRVGMVWLVLGGPAVVVVASLVTAVVAYRGADEVLVNTPSARILPVRPTSETPAMTARNHAATAAADQ
jgi:hypothetical protein